MRPVKAKGKIVSMEIQNSRIPADRSDILLDVDLTDVTPPHNYNHNGYKL